MSDEQQHPDVRRLWQSQVDENTPVPLDDLRNRVSKMNRILLLRTFVAGLAFLIFTGLFLVVLLTSTVSAIATRADIEILQSVFLIGATYCFWQLISLLRRMRVKTLEGEPSACAAFYRSELDRQRKFYRRSAVWVPLIFSAMWIWGSLSMPALKVPMIVIWVLFVPFWVYQSLEIARKSQREIDELNSGFR